MNTPYTRFMKCSVPPLIRVATVVLCLGIVALISPAQPSNGGNSPTDAGQPGPMNHGLRLVARMEFTAGSRRLEAAVREALGRCEVALMRTTKSLIRVCEHLKSLVPNPEHAPHSSSPLPSTRLNAFQPQSSTDT